MSDEKCPRGHFSNEGAMTPAFARLKRIARKLAAVSVSTGDHVSSAIDAVAPTVADKAIPAVLPAGAAQAARPAVKLLANPRTRQGAWQRLKDYARQKVDDATWPVRAGLGALTELDPELHEHDVGEFKRDYAAYVEKYPRSPRLWRLFSDTAELIDPNMRRERREQANALLGRGLYTAVRAEGLNELNRSGVLNHPVMKLIGHARRGYGQLFKPEGAAALRRFSEAARLWQDSDTDFRAIGREYPEIAGGAARAKAMESVSAPEVMRTLREGFDQVGMPLGFGDDRHYENFARLHMPSLYIFRASEVVDMAQRVKGTDDPYTALQRIATGANPPALQEALPRVRAEIQKFERDVGRAPNFGNVSEETVGQLSNAMAGAAQLLFHKPIDRLTEEQSTHLSRVFDRILRGQDPDLWAKKQDIDFMAGFLNIGAAAYSNATQGARMLNSLWNMPNRRQTASGLDGRAIADLAVRSTPSYSEQFAKSVPHAIFRAQRGPQWDRMSASEQQNAVRDLIADNFEREVEKSISEAPIQDRAGLAKNIVYHLLWRRSKAPDKDVAELAKSEASSRLNTIGEKARRLGALALQAAPMLLPASAPRARGSRR